MACGTGFCVGKIIASIVAVGVGGYAAYNYTTTGCVLGSCDSESAIVETEGNAQAVSATGELAGECSAAEMAACETACAEATACEDAAAACDKATDCAEATECTKDAGVLEVAATEGSDECALSCDAEKIAAASDCNSCAETGECDGECGEIAATETADNSDG